MKTNVKKFLGRENKYREEIKRVQKERKERKKEAKKQKERKKERKKKRRSGTITCQTRTDDLQRVLSHF